MTRSDLLAALGEGPARMSAGDVAASQRRRMLAAMVSATAEKGYVRVAVADVVGRARVSRATFYEQFHDKADCFLAAFRACADDLTERLRGQWSSSTPPRVQLRRQLDSYLCGLAAFPEGAQVCLVETYAAGPEAASERRRVQGDFVALVRRYYAALAEGGEPVRPLTDFDFEAIVGAISSIVTNRVAAGKADELPGLTGPLERFVLGHFGLDPDPASADEPPEPAGA